MASIFGGRILPFSTAVENTTTLAILQISKDYTIFEKNVDGGNIKHWDYRSLFSDYDAQNKVSKLSRKLVDRGLLVF